MHSQLYEPEQVLLSQEKSEFKKLKLLQNLSNENIQYENIPELMINHTKNNITTWVEKIGHKFMQIKKDSPHLMANFIFTGKKLS